MANTTITARIYKNGDRTKPLNGYIVITARSNISENGDFFVPDAVTYPLVNGMATLILVSTDVSKVSYNFAIYENAEEGGRSARLAYSFDAVVPSSLTPIDLTSLTQQSALRYDQQDASLLTLATFILSQGNNLLQNRLLDKLLNPRGVFNRELVYSKGDSVIYDGDGYLYVSDIASKGNLPTNPSFWRKYVSKGVAGSATTGDTSPYGAAWSDSAVAPSRSTLYAKIETLQTVTEANNKYAPIADGVMVRALQSTITPLTLEDSSARLAHTAWIQAQLAPLRSQMPVGGRVKWDNTQALPARYLKADGSAVLRATYAALYTVYGNAYGAGDGVTTFNLPNDNGFIIFTGI